MKSISRSHFITVTTAFAVAAAAWGNPLPALAFSSGPPDARTGAPGELTCTACHLSFPLNSGSGTLMLLDPPDSYVPEQTYRLAVQLSDPEAMRWGFELTVLDAADAPAGDVASIDANTQTSTPLSGREYLKHTSAGTAAGTTGSRTWEFDWTAPVDGTGPVTFWVAGNAANFNFANTGDRIYNANFTIDENDATAAPLARVPARLLPSTPNPFNPRTMIRFELDVAQSVRLGIFDLRGRSLRELVADHRPAGLHEVVWDGRDAAGRSLASGNYVVRLVTPEQTAGQVLTLIE